MACDEINSDVSCWKAKTDLMALTLLERNMTHRQIADYNGQNNEKNEMMNFG